MSTKIKPEDMIRHETVYSVGLDVSQRSTSICVLDETGRTVLEGQAKTHPYEIARFLQKRLSGPLKLGMETGSLSAWLYHGLRKMEFDIVCLDALHLHRALSLKRQKTDRNDAHGIADVVRLGPEWMKIAHLKSTASQELRVELAARSRLVKQRVDLENELCGLMKPFGYIVQRGARGAEVFDERVLDALAQAADAGFQLQTILKPLLETHRLLVRQIADYDKRLEQISNNDPVCQRLMTVPGVGPITALAFRAVIDDPSRFTSSADVAVYLGLTPRRYQSGEMDHQGRISKRGDIVVRTHLVQAATTLLTQTKRWSALKAWGIRLSKRIGFSKAKVAVARKLAIILYRIWRDQSEFQWSKAAIETAVQQSAATT